MSAIHQIRHALRKIIALASTVLPLAFSVRAERYLRGWEEHGKLAGSDVIIVSYGKSGRTWLRVLLSRYYQLRYELPETALLNDDNLHGLNAAVPRIMFTHDNYVSDFTGDPGSKTAYAGKRVILLVRHPADTAVSIFFQWKHRTRQRKKVINTYPALDSDLPLADFVLAESAGLPKIIRFMNLWAAELGRIDQLFVVRYESLRLSTAETLGRILTFMGEDPRPDQLAECVRFASVENMRTLEQQGFFQSGRLKPGDPSNPESYKVRRAKVGGYRDYFPADEAAGIESVVAARLSPVYGYSDTPADARVV